MYRVKGTDVEIFKDPPKKKRAPGIPDSIGKL